MTNFLGVLCFPGYEPVGRSLRRTSQNGWSLCQRKFSHSYSTVLSERYPTLHCQQCSLFFPSCFHWFAEVWVQSEHLYRPISLSVPQSLSLSCASWKCILLVYMWGCEPHSWSLNKHSGYAFVESVCNSLWMGRVQRIATMFAAWTTTSNNAMITVCDIYSLLFAAMFCNEVLRTCNLVYIPTTIIKGNSPRWLCSLCLSNSKLNLVVIDSLFSITKGVGLFWNVCK